MKQDEDMLSVVVERDFRHAPEKIWRALTQPHLIAEWLMSGDFNAAVGHRFAFRQDWGVIDCEVQEVEPHRLLSYSWNSGPLKSVVTWTLAPISGGTRLRMEQTGFTRDEPRYYGGAKTGWPTFISRLEELLDRLISQEAPT